VLCVVLVFGAVFGPSEEREEEKILILRRVVVVYNIYYSKRLTFAISSSIL
jgi:hypothetical protein